MTSKCRPMRTVAARFIKRSLEPHVSWLPLLLTIVVLSGCATVGPDYVRPKTPVLGTWHTPLEEGLTSKEADRDDVAAWWKALNDPLLCDLIERSVAGNLDLKAAKARIREARARRRVAEAGRFPTLSSSGSANRSGSSGGTGGGSTRSLYVAGFDAGWELDLFGGIRRSVEAAEADLEANQESLRDVLVSLAAEVALNYVETRTYQARLRVAEKNLEAQEETYNLAQWRHQAGLSDELSVQQALYNLENTRSQIPNLRIGLEGAKNRLAVLLGAHPLEIPKELEEVRPIPLTPLSVAVGVPAEVLRLRPDIRQAERVLAAQSARVGVATADLYPKLTLNGSIGLEAFSLMDLVPWSPWGREPRRR